MIDLLSQLDIDLFLKIVIVLIMLSVGLSLEFRDLAYVWRHRNLLLIGLFAKLVILPVLGFLLIEWLPVPDIFKLGTIIVLVCPGGTTSNVITYWMKGNPALTIFLTTISSLIAVFSIPLLVNTASIYYFGSSTSFRLSVGDTVLEIILVIVLPALVGLAIRRYYKYLAIEVEKVLKPVSVVLLGLVFIIKLFFEDSETSTGLSISEVLYYLPILMVVNVAGLFAGYWFPLLFGVNKKDRMTMGVEMGIQNIGLALLIGGVLIGENELIKPALIYSAFSFWSTALFAYFINRKELQKT